MSQPGLLLLDEPSAGLAPNIVEALFLKIAAIRDEGVSILLVEQNTRRALQISEMVYVVRGGEIVLQGTPEYVGADESALREAYLA
jgi:branched-chain amino acid transport system ATP-binding protein